MPLFKFEDFIFDSTSHNLSHKRTKVAIRPKALKLLSLLIQNRHRILSKAEIMSSIWGCVYARDHLLFQLISELRKPPFKSEFVRTQPNEGYQWSVATKTSNNRLFVPQLIAAGLACLSLLALPVLYKADNNPKQTMQLPAYGALSKGIIALQSGEKDKAIQWFEFALSENPDSVESTIFLAETLYQQNRPEESSKYLQNVLTKENLSAYNKATAANILSRISEQQGKFDDALRYAQKSAQTNVLGQCSVDFVDKRIRKLEGEIAMSPIHADRNNTNAKEDVPMSTLYAKQCNELKSSPVETSLCQPLRNENVDYVGIIKTPTFRVT